LETRMESCHEKVTGEADDASVHRGGEGSGGSVGAPSCARSWARVGARCSGSLAQLGYGVESVRTWVK
jgi:hypothetical protein